MYRKFIAGIACSICLALSGAACSDDDQSSAPDPKVQENTGTKAPGASAEKPDDGVNLEIEGKLEAKGDERPSVEVGVGVGVEAEADTEN